MVDLGRHFRYFETFYQEESGERKYSFEKVNCWFVIGQNDSEGSD